MGAGTGSFADRAKLAVKRDDVVKALERTINSHKLAVDNKLSPYAPPNARIDFSHQGVTAPAVKPLSPDEQIASFGGTPPSTPMPKTPAELREARKRGSDPRVTGDAAAGEHAPKLGQLRTYMAGSTPAQIERLAEAALQAVSPDPWAGKPGSAYARDVLIPADVEDAKKDAEKREKALVKNLAARAVGKAMVRPGASWHDKVTQGVAVPTAAEIEEVAKVEYGFKYLRPDDIDKIVKDVEAALGSKLKSKDKR
jgi:hypothetical protein